MRLADLEFWAKKLESPQALLELGAESADLSLTRLGLRLCLHAGRFHVLELVSWDKLRDCPDTLDLLGLAVERASARLIRARGIG